MRVSFQNIGSGKGSYDEGQDKWYRELTTIVVAEDVRRAKRIFDAIDTAISSNSAWGSCFAHFEKVSQSPNRIRTPNPTHIGAMTVTSLEDLYWTVLDTAWQ